MLVHSLNVIIFKILLEVNIVQIQRLVFTELMSTDIYQHPILNVSLFVVFILNTQLLFIFDLTQTVICNVYSSILRARAN